MVYKKDIFDIHVTIQVDSSLHKEMDSFKFPIDDVDLEKFDSGSKSFPYPL